MVLAMPDALGPSSEFGGKIQKNRVQPSPHVPTASEKLMLLYTTGDVDGTKNPDSGEAFAGLIPAADLLRIRTEEGVMEKGQIWEQMQQEGADEIAALADEVPDVG